MAPEVWIQPAQHGGKHHVSLQVYHRACDAKPDAARPAARIEIRMSDSEQDGRSGNAPGPPGRLTWRVGSGGESPKCESCTKARVGQLGEKSEESANQNSPWPVMIAVSKKRKVEMAEHSSRATPKNKVPQLRLHRKIDGTCCNGRTQSIRAHEFQHAHRNPRCAQLPGEALVPGCHIPDKNRDPLRIWLPGVRSPILAGKKINIHLAGCNPHN